MEVWKTGQEVISNAIGPYDRYCDGYFSFYPRKGGNYVCAITLSVAKVPKLFGHAGSRKLDEINAYDLAETEGAYIGQLNFIAVTSFCGPGGVIWGYDLAKSVELRGVRIPGLSEVVDHKGKKVPVYSAAPLEKAAELLFGTKRELHFPIIPGAQVPHAGKNIEKAGPVRLYCAIGIGIANDRKRVASLYMEDAGVLKREPDKILETMAKSIIEVGRNHDVEYREIFINIKCTDIVNEDEIGCAFVAVPYIVLPRKAVPKEGIGKLMELSLEEWGKEINPYFLCNTKS
ncbi:histidine decarboxylase, pyruvoyl type [Chloroflexota bacterium]